MINRKGCTYWFLTLTVPNVENISRWDISKIGEQFAELWNSWCFQEVEMPKAKRLAVTGGVRSIECKYEPDSKSWHPHVHVLFEFPGELPRHWLKWVKFKWLMITGDARYLHLQRAYSETKRGKKKYNHLNEKALREVCKYITKCAEFAGDHLLVAEFLEAFERVRRIQCFGCFHGGRKPGQDEAGIAETTVFDPEAENLLAKGYVELPFRARMADTELLPDGTRQLTFAFAERVREFFEAADPPWELSPFEPQHVGQKEIGFAGVMPAESVSQCGLFDAVA